MLHFALLQMMFLFYMSFKANVGTYSRAAADRNHLTSESSKLGRSLAQPAELPSRFAPLTDPKHAENGVDPAKKLNPKNSKRSLHQFHPVSSFLRRKLCSKRAPKNPKVFVSLSRKTTASTLTGSLLDGSFHRPTTFCWLNEDC